MEEGSVPHTIKSPSKLSGDEKDSLQNASKLPAGSTFSFALDNRPKATRVSLVKVRTGCITCKKRHVKCDETKPACRKCINLHGVCGGYISSPAAQHDSSRTRSNKVRTKDRRDASWSTNFMVDHVTLVTEPCDSIFSSQLDHDYFASWKCISRGLAGGIFPSRLFTTSMIQLGREEPAIRHGIIALGCMKSALENRFAGGSFLKTKSESVHYRNALLNYCRAMKHVHNATSGERSVRNAILCCILFIAFEAMNNNRAAMLKHIYHGLSIIRQFVMSTTGHEYEAGVKSPAPDVMEDEILQLFLRLDFHAWSTGIADPESDPPGPCLSETGAVDVSDKMPERFRDILDAHKWWNLTQHFALNYSRELVLLRKQHTVEAKAKGTAPPVRLCDVPGWKPLRGRYIGALARWAESFQPLYERARRDKHNDVDTWVQVTSLRMQYLWTYCSVHSGTFSDYSILHSMTPLYNEIIQLSERLLVHTQRKDGGMEPFAIENGAVVALFVAATKTRDRGQRLRAVELLRRFPRRDGLWDSRITSALCAWSNMLEDEYTQASLSEEEHWKNLSQRKGWFDDKEPKAYCQAPRLDPRTGQWHVKVHTLTW